LTATELPALEPSMKNSTEPVGAAVAGETAATVAVKMTCCPFSDGLADDVTLVVLLALFTAVSTVLEVLLPLVESPVPFVATLASLCNVVFAADDATITRRVNTWFEPEVRPVAFV
jgi:hypothetical protein